MYSEYTIPCYIELTDGDFALCDHEDYQMLSAFDWRKHDGGYAIQGLRNTYMHRMVMLPDPGQQVDHINGDRLDNRKRNLRSCTAEQNAANKSAAGVIWHHGAGKWQARIHSKKNGVTTTKTFSDRIEAQLWYDAEKIQRFGEFAKTKYLRATGPYTTVM